MAGYKKLDAMIETVQEERSGECVWKEDVCM